MRHSAAKALPKGIENEMEGQGPGFDVIPKSSGSVQQIARRVTAINAKQSAKFGKPLPAYPTRLYRSAFARDIPGLRPFRPANGEMLMRVWFASFA